MAIVGAGVSGAVTAAVLTSAGYNVVVIDRRPPGEGSTLASTAMVLFEIDTPLSKLADKIGAKRAERAFLRSHRAVAALGELIRSQEIRCAWKDRDALLLAGDQMGQRALAAEAAYRARIGLPSRFLKGAEVRSRYGFDRTGAIVSSGSAELNPVQLTAECLRRARHKGARVYSRHEIAEIHATSRQVLLATVEGATLTARALGTVKGCVFASGYDAIIRSSTHVEIGMGQRFGGYGPCRYDVVTVGRNLLERLIAGREHRTTRLRKQRRRELRLPDVSLVRFPLLSGRHEGWPKAALTASLL